MACTTKIQGLTVYDTDVRKGGHRRDVAATLRQKSNTTPCL
jgi:hypothetical protein